MDSQCWRIVSGPSHYHRNVKQSYNWLIDRKIPAVVRRFERLIEKEAKFVGRGDGEPMVDRKTRVRWSMLDHWVGMFYRKMEELKREAKIDLRMDFGTSERDEQFTKPT